MPRHWFTQAFTLLPLLMVVQWGGEQVVHAQERGATPDTVSLDTPEKDGTYYLEFEATIPASLGRTAIRHQVFRDSERVTFTPEQEGHDWNDGYVPYYSVQHRGAVSAPGEREARLMYLLPIEARAGDEVAVTPADGHTVGEGQLHPSIGGVDASVEFAGEGKAVYFSGAAPTATVTIDGPPGKELSGRLLLQHLRLADFRPGAPQWRQGQRVVEVAQPTVRPLDLQLSDETGTSTFSVTLPDDRHRLIGVTLVLEDGEKRWAEHLGSAAVVPPRDTSRFHKDGFFISHYSEDRAVLEAYKKMGIDWVRGGLSWSVFEPQRDQYDWSRTDAFYEKLRDAHIYAIQMAHIAPEWAQPDTAGLRPFPYKNMMWKTDKAPAQKHLDKWEEAYEDFFRRYQDVARAANVWNEPWEGRGITGWASTGDHYRKLFNGVYRAVQEVDSTIKMVAADSGHNTDWKLFSAGLADRLDVISTHYSSAKTDYAFSMADYYDGTEVWETETWRSWIGDAASARRVLHYLANGGTKISLFNERMLFDHRGYPTPAAVWTAGMRDMLDRLTFERVIHPERPPFVLLFSGNEGRQVAVLTTSLAEHPGDRGSFRWQFAEDDVQLQLSGETEDYEVYDLLANPRPQAEGGTQGLHVSVGPEPVYIEFDGSPEAFAERLRSATYEDLRPVQITTRDLTGAPGTSRSASFPVILENAFAGQQSATVRVTGQGLSFAHATRTVTLPPAGSTKELFFEVESHRSTAGNRYPVDIAVETDRGTATLKETVHAAVIARGSPTVDGNVQDWSSFGAIPVRMQQLSRVGMGEQQMKRPWEEFARETGSFAAQMAYAADDDNLYMMARVQDASRDVLPSMLSGETLHDFQNEPADHIYIEKGPHPSAEGDLIHLALGSLSADPYLPKYELRPPDHPLHRFGSYVSTQYKYLIYPTQGADAEVFRLRTPDYYFLHPLPIDYKWLSTHSRVEGADVTVQRTDDGYVYEVALPWSELSGIPHSPGDQIRMSMAVQDGGQGSRLVWSETRSAASLNRLDFEPGFGDKWSTEAQWTFVGRE